MNKAGKLGTIYPDRFPYKLNEYELFTENIIKSNWILQLIYDMRHLTLSLEHVFDYDYIQLYNEIINLPDTKHRDAILFYYRDGLNCNEIARKLNISPGVINQRMSKGFLKLRHPARTKNFEYKLMTNGSNNLINFLSDKLIVGESSDTFHFSEETSLGLRKLYNPKDDTSNTPSDIFFNKTIPMIDCNIEIACADNSDDRIIGRVAIDKRYMEIAEILLNSTTNDEALNIGFIYLSLVKTDKLIPYDDMTIIIPMNIRHGDDNIHISPRFIPKRFDEFINDTNKITLCSDVLMKFGKDILSLWYSIQIALLHPTVKEVISRNHEVDDRPVVDGKNKWKYRKRNTTYVRHHVITNPEEIEKANTKTIKTRSGCVRRCMVWYVIGHWRTYKRSGKKVFIKPYWKGPMRKLQRNLDDGRDRGLEICEESQTN